LLCIYEKVRNLPGEQSWTPPNLSVPSVYHLPSDFSSKIHESLTVADVQKLQSPKSVIYKTQLPILDNLFLQQRIILLTSVLSYFVDNLPLLSDSTSATFCAICAK
jgi:hypothetical protein